MTQTHSPSAPGATRTHIAALDSASDRADRWCIIGAGPAGLATARALLEAQIPFEVLERHRDVGGIWDMDNPGSPMYDSAHFISSKTQSAFDGFPMPDHFPDYPGWRSIRDYIRAFADRYALRERIEFDTAVERARPAGAEWEVRLASGEVRRYRGVVLATGHNWDPISPSYPGRFDGESFHAMRYHHGEQLAGKRVLIVGGGNSGCDIACDAATHAARALISVRRGYHFLPKHVFGQPTDAFFRGGPHLPAWLAQPLLTALLRVLVGSPTRYGLPKPDHRVLESHPIMNTQLLHHLAHGDIVAKPDVAELRGRTVRFTDGTEEELDAIIYATGYRATLPVLDPATVSLGDGVSGLYLNVFPRDVERLFVIGLFETDGAAYPVVSRQAALVARVIRAERDAPGRAHWFAAQKAGTPPKLNGGVRYLRSPRHAIYVQFDEYVHVLDRMIGRMKPGNG